jgi:hypothetical protein
MQGLTMRIRAATIIFLLLVCLLPVGRQSNAQDSPLTVVSAEQVRNLLGEETTGAALTGALSADGSSLAWYEDQQDLCIYTFADDEIACRLVLTQLEVLPVELNWSYDARYVAFTENLYANFWESDIWVFDVAESYLSNRTEDLVYAWEQWLFSDEPYMLDYGVTWHPRRDDLYFFRTDNTQEQAADLGQPLTLERIQPIEGDAETIMTLTDVWPQLSVSSTGSNPFLSGTTAISPDGARMAVLAHGSETDDDRNGVWLLDLVGEAEPQQLTSLFFGGGLDGAETIANALDWTSDGAGLVVAAQEDNLNLLELVTTFHYVDVATGAITLLVDLSDISADDLFETGANGYANIVQSAIGATLIPDTTTLLLLGHNRQTQTAALFALDVATGDRYVVHELETFNLKPTEQSTASRDGKALIGGWLFILEGFDTE